MKIHNVTQGSPEWHALRARCRNASELAAVRGRSKYQKRTDLIRIKATGITPDIDDATQRLFDRGHEAEAKARAIVEQMIGEDLYPVVATTDDEYLLASSDGSNMLGSLGFEHKLLSESLVAQIRAGQLDPHYTDQMDQQFAVFGFEKIIFACSDGTPENFYSMEYTGNPESIARIRADWAQFDEDVANYQPEVIEAKPILTANPIDNLPALVIEVTGRVTHSNLVEFKAAANAVISSIKTELVTDQDFVDAIDRVKYLKNVVDKAKNAKQNTLDQTESIAIVHKSLDDVIKMATDVRLALEKKIAEEKDRRKYDIVSEAQLAFNDHYHTLAERIGFGFSVVYANFGESVKGLKSLDSMRDKVSVALANAKIEANAIADRIEANRKTVEDMSLLPDFAQVCTKAPEDFAALLAMRVAQRKAAEEKRLEQERERIRAEEQAKAQREAAEALRKQQMQEAEAERARREAEHKANVERINAEQAAQREAERKAVVPALQSVNDAITREFSQTYPNGAPVFDQSNIKENGDPVMLSPDGKRSVFCDVDEGEVKASGQTIKLGEICTRLGFTVTADFLSSLGVEPVATDKNAKLYPASKFPTICRLISEHVMALAFKKAA